MPSLPSLDLTSSSQERPPPQTHTRSSSFFSFRNKQALSNQQTGHQRTISMGNGDNNANVLNNISTFTPQQQQQGMTRTIPVQAPLARTSSTQEKSRSPPPGQVPASQSLHVEIRSVVQLTAAHAHKIYFSGPLIRRVERQPDGQRPAKDEGWSDVWAQLGGTTLSIWDMNQIQEASKHGKEVPPTYVNTTDAFVQVLGAVTIPGSATSPPKKYSNVLTLNTAGSNLLLFSCPTVGALMSWAAALRLSAWEKSRLEEIYTAHLIRITLGVPDAPTTLIHGRMEGWVRIRISGQTDWKRMWMVVSAGAEDAPTEHLRRVGSVTTSATALPKKKRMSNLFSWDNTTAAQQLPVKPIISMYMSPKTKDKKKALLTMKDVTQAFAVYPERPELISRSTLIKVEGLLGDEETAASMRSREGWVLIMPELEGGLGQAAEMLKWVVALHDAFQLYGRPEAWTWDPRDSVSLMFAYPVGPNKDLLFLDREFAETLDPRDERTSSIRSRLIGILLDRMRGHEVQARPPRLSISDKPPTLPPIGGPSGPQIPPINFGESQTSQEKKQLSPITERSSGHTNDQRSADASNLFNPPQFPQQRDSLPSHDRPISPPPESQDNVLSNRPLTSNPNLAGPLQSISGPELQTRSPFTSNAIAAVHHSSGIPTTDEGFQRQLNPTPPVLTANRPTRDGQVSGMDPTMVQLPLSPVSESRPSFMPTTFSSPQVTIPRSPTVPKLTSPHSEVGHEERSRSSSERPSSQVISYLPATGTQGRSPSASVLTSPHSEASNEDIERRSTLISPHSPQGILRNGSVSSRSPPSPVSEYKSPLFSPPAPQLKSEEVQNFSNKNQSRRLPTTIAEQDDDSSSSHDSSSQLNLHHPRTTDTNNGNGPVHRQGISSQEASNKAVASNLPGDRMSPSRQGLGRKPSGARAQVTRSYNGDGLSSSQQLTEEEIEPETSSQIHMDNLQARPAASSEDANLDALAALSYLDVEDRPSSPKQVKVEPLNLRSAHRAPSPPPVKLATDRSQYKSSFAPSKQAAERKAKVQAQQAAHHAAVHKPGRVNGKKKSRIAGTWNESSEDDDEDDDDEDEDDEDEDDRTNPDIELPLANKQSLRSAPSNTSLHQSQNQTNEQAEGSQQYSHLRPRTLPQIPGSHNYPEESNPPPRRMVSDQFSEPGRRTHHDGTQIRTQAEFPQPGAARQTMWSQVLDPGRPSNAHLDPPRDTFVQLEPAETMTKAFAPQGLLSAGLQDRQDRSAKRQEELARETGASLINVPNKPPPPQMGLLGAITAHERERKREGGVGAALTEREREKRVAEDRQRRFDDHQRQQLDQMQQGGSMYGGQFPGYNMPMMMMNPMMGLNPMMTGGGMAPMMTGQMGFMPGYNPQHMFAAQQAAQAYQQAMMAFSIAGSQAGGDVGGGMPQLNPAMTGSNMGGFDPRMSVMGMPMMGAAQMAPVGMQMTGMSVFDPRFGPSMNNSPGSMNDPGLAPPPGFGGQTHGQPSSRNSSPVGRGSPLARPTDSAEHSAGPNP